MEETPDYFIYKRRYNHSIKDKIEQKSHNIKEGLLKFLYKNKFTRQYLHSVDTVSFIYKEKHRKKRHTPFTFDIDGFDIDEESYVYKDISLDRVNYFETIEIDNFDKYKKKIISRFAKYTASLGVGRGGSKENLKEKLSQIKVIFDTTSHGGKLFSLSFSQNQKSINDLIHFISVSYIKTNESYFIFNIEVTPSDKFKDLFENIISSEDIELSSIHYNSFINILRTKQFNSHISYHPSLKKNNIEGLLSDLNHQVKENVTKYFKGYFHDSKISTILPSIVYYEVDNIKEFHRDEELKSNFDTHFDGHYCLEDGGIEIYQHYFSQKNQSLIQVVREKGHGSNGDVRMNNDNIERYCLLLSLAFPCVFQGILKE